jgi:hypothetical protein
MMIMVCPYSFGFSSSWVTDCDTAVAQSEFVTEVGTTRAALRRLLVYAAQLMGVRYSLPQYGRIKSHYQTKQVRLCDLRMNSCRWPLGVASLVEKVLAEWLKAKGYLK